MWTPLGNYFSAYYRVQFHSFACDCLIFSAPVVEKTILFELNASGTLVEESLITNIWFVVLAQLYSIDNMSIVCQYHSLITIAL